MKSIFYKLLHRRSHLLPSFELATLCTRICVIGAATCWTKPGRSYYKNPCSNRRRWPASETRHHAGPDIRYPSRCRMTGRHPQGPDVAGKSRLRCRMAARHGLYARWMGEHPAKEQPQIAHLLFAQALQTAQSRRTLLQQTQILQTGSNPMRQARFILPRHG